VMRSIRRLKVGKQIIVLEVSQKLLADQSFQQLRDDGQIRDWSALACNSILYGCMGT